MSSDPTLTKLPAAPNRRRRADFVIIGALLLLFLAGLVGLAAATGWEETVAQFLRLSLAQIVLLLGLSLANYMMRALRWHVFARRLGLVVSPAQSLRHYLGGFAMSVTPGRVGELVRMRWLRRETGWSVERTAPLALVDRASDLAVMALILALAVSLTAGGMGGGILVAGLALCVAYIATRPRLIAAMVTFGYRLTGRLPRLFARARIAARSLHRFGQPRVLLAALGLGCAGWFAEGYAFHLLLGWMGSEIGLWKAVGIFVFATLAGGLTGTPGGVGGAEAAMIALLTLEGVPMEVSVPATAVIRVTTLWFALAIGIAAFPLAEKLSTRGRDALENR
ncbi:lysylphosphatidylglycerol synthase transmembrane domain-containing protein [Albidovulum sediminicola]|uniref:Flippase-like domain-containing protein n=1 Tax=Albidovulum sediminicola TaxID=2984331 RepID=A0ABT2Z356_9RHOB|nr:lysylphosphatidylglycerol synthase transmembrane domain-containing protein [Defluviimonas sp. WL0075]MCV2865583.1 flippase-like domain-containing protein [Defluviimonas sp. WL0075]